MLGIFLDLETTGLDSTRHCVIDIAFEIVDINSNKVLASFNRIVKQPREIWDNHDPISLSINGFTWDLVSQGVERAEVGKEIIQLLQSYGVARGSAVFICQNPAFDRSFFSQLVEVYTQEKLNWPYHWLDMASMFWTISSLKCKENGTPFPEKLSLSKNDIAKVYDIPPEQEPHRAFNGVKHLMSCYQALFGLTFT